MALHFFLFTHVQNFVLESTNGKHLIGSKPNIGGSSKFAKVGHFVTLNADVKFDIVINVSAM